MTISKSSWYENAMAVERDPLVYALKIGEAWKLVKNEKNPVAYGSTYVEVHPTIPWNYGLVEVPAAKMDSAFSLTKKAAVAAYSWNPGNAPIEIKAAAKRIPGSYIMAWPAPSRTALPMIWKQKPTSNKSP